MTRKIAASMKRIRRLHAMLYDEVLTLNQHQNNRIAAHKAHVTMAKKAARKNVRHKIEVGGA